MKSLVKFPGLFNNSLFTSIQTQEIIKVQYIPRDTSGNVSYGHLVSAYRMNASWSASTVKCNSVIWNASAGYLSSNNVYNNSGSVGFSYPYDITSVYKEWRSGSYGGTSNHYGIMLKGDYDHVRISFGSKNNSNYPPCVVVEYAPIPTSISITNKPLQHGSDTLKVGNSHTLGISVSPSNANSNINWTSTNSNVASINYSTGTITAISPGKTTIKATSTVNSQATNSFELTVYRYAATLNSYFDMGYPVKYGMTGTAANKQSLSSARISNVVENVANRYEQLLDIKIIRNNAVYYDTLVDRCRNTINTNNITTMCTSHPNLNCTGSEWTNMLNIHQNTTREKGNQHHHIYWTGHRFSNGNSFSAIIPGVLISMADYYGWGTIPTQQEEEVFMHELGHNFGSRHHYHQSGTEDAFGRCSLYEICSECNPNGRPSSCVMWYSIGQSINNSNILCNGCKNEMIVRLNAIN